MLEGGTKAYLKKMKIQRRRLKMKMNAQIDPFEDTKDKFETLQ